MKYSKEILEKLIIQDNLSYEEIGKKFNVTGSAIRKAAKRNNIKLPKRRKINKSETFNRKDSVKCDYCGKQLTKRSNRFCNNECKHKYYNKKVLENWKNKKFNGQKGKNQISKIIRDYMLEKYDFKCQKCNWSEINPITNKVPLQIHHIDGDALNNSEENLEVLCPNCHSLTENFGNLNKNSTRKTL